MMHSPQSTAVRLAGLLAVGALACGCSATVIPGVPSASTEGVAEQRKVTDATRSACIDFEARGGALYRVFVVPMLTSGRPGYQQVAVNAAQMQLATDSIAQMPTSNLDKAASDVRNDSRRLIASAGSFGVYENTEGTALLTAFTQLAVDCTKAKYQPSWFQPADLANH